MLLESIGDIFDQDLSNSLERFLVPDRGTDREGLEVVLLVESPHTTEVRPYAIDARYPLAGATETSAGRRVTDKFIECGLELAPPVGPVGSLVHQGDTVQQLGIMNVCQLPFQEGAYINQGSEHQGDEVRQNERWPDYIRCMVYIRKEPYVRHYQGFGDPNGNGAGHLEGEINQLQDVIAEDLRERLDTLCENYPDVLLVPCGKVAAAFYLKARVAYLPHPTNRGRRGERWVDLNCQNACLQRILERLQPET